MDRQMPKRTLLKAISLTAAGIALSRVPASAAPEPRVLVAYFSRTGNTRVIANQIRRALSATLFEIKTATPYPEDYQTTVDQAAAETKAGYLPPLMQFVADIQSYDTIFLGFPIWGMTAPPVIRSFLMAHDLAGKGLVPFVTHGGYGLGNGISVVESHARKANVRPGFSLEADQEKRTLESVSAWLDTEPQTD
ncbi:flavodoxin [Agrobacterium sp. Ap1]|uniref:flavodoxin n=1 Tax=Agrobacterium sp. Ap1 TaxID=2815337 RepID=UPI002570AFC0|nr:flavodoxin [Agrobacterium sp. Ap1]